MEVIGEDGYTYEIDEDELEGDVMGDILGYAGPMGDYEGDAESEIDYDDEGEPVLVGARRKRRRVRKKRGRRLVQVRKPGWRRSQLAPGVIAADQGMLVLPMAGVQGQQFTSAINQIEFRGQVQKPFRGERLLVSTVRTGTTAVGRLLAQFFVGTDLQQLDVAAFDAEQIGDPNAFGVRMANKPCQPGVFIRLICTLSAPLTSPDTIDTYVSLMGRYIG